MRACHWKARLDQSDKWHHQSRTATFHWSNHKGWTTSHHFSRHEHRKQSPRQKRGHRKEDTGTHKNWKGFPRVILPLYLQAASEHLQTCHLHSLPWTAFGSELSSPNSFHWIDPLILRELCEQSLLAPQSCFGQSAAVFSKHGITNLLQWPSHWLLLWWLTRRSQIWTLEKLIISFILGKSLEQGCTKICMM